MMQFLEDEQGKGKPPITPEERIELEMLRGEYALLKSNLEKKSMAAEKKKSLVEQSAQEKKKKNDSGSSSDSEVRHLINMIDMLTGLIVG